MDKLQKRRKRQKRYRQSVQGRIVHRAARKRYRNSPKGRKAEREARKRYRESQKGRMMIRSYSASTKKKEIDKRYNQTPAGKLVKERARLKSYYGITLEDYNAMLDNQKGVCKICGNPETLIRKGKLSKFTVDHDHNTGKIRGLLCHKCNSILGFANDNIKVLEHAIVYLKGGSCV